MEVSKIQNTHFTGCNYHKKPIMPQECKKEAQIEDETPKISYPNNQVIDSNGMYRYFEKRIAEANHLIEIHENLAQTTDEELESKGLYRKTTEPSAFTSYMLKMDYSRTPFDEDDELNCLKHTDDVKVAFGTDAYDPNAQTRLESISKVSSPNKRDIILPPKATTDGCLCFAKGISRYNYNEYGHYIDSIFIADENGNPKALIKGEKTDNSQGSEVKTAQAVYTAKDGKLVPLEKGSDEYNEIMKKYAFSSSTINSIVTW